jgi:hypothetical protein
VRRILGVVASAVIALSLSRAIAPAAELPFGTLRPNIASQLMLSLFGEVSDSSATFSAQSGNRSSESPLRELALGVAAPSTTSFTGVGAEPRALSTQRIALADLSGGGGADLDRAGDSGLLATDVRFAPSDGSNELRAGYAASHTALYTAAYQPVAPLPIISPDPGAVAFDAPPMQPEASKSASFTLGSDRHAKELDLNLSGAYQQLLPNDSASLTTTSAATSAWQPPEGNVAVGVPNFAGSNKLSLGAALAVPVFHGLTLNLNYAAVRSYGGDVLPGLMSLDAANNSYVGGLTYNIPYSSSTLSISAYQNRYGESVLPNNGVTQTGGDVNLTVKF